MAESTYSDIVALAREAHAASRSTSDVMKYLQDRGLSRRDVRRATFYLQRNVHSYQPDAGDLAALGLWQSKPVRAGASGRTAVGHPCRYCGQPASDWEHVWPKARGGDDHPNNLVPACRPCNSTKGTRSVLTDPCPACGIGRDPGDVETATGAAYYHCRCGESWVRMWDLQAVTL